jgi:hypothetical protein
VIINRYDRPTLKNGKDATGLEKILLLFNSLFHPENVFKNRVARFEQ